MSRYPESGYITVFFSSVQVLYGCYGSGHTTFSRLQYGCLWQLTGTTITAWHSVKTWRFKQLCAGWDTSLHKHSELAHGLNYHLNFSLLCPCIPPVSLPAMFWLYTQSVLVNILWMWRPVAQSHPSDVWLRTHLSHSTVLLQLAIHLWTLL